MRPSRALLLVASILLIPAIAPAAPTIILPGPADIPPRPSARDVLGPNPGEFPNKTPGDVSGSEVVRVALEPSGAASNIVVDQTITVTGVGDYAIEVSGPAFDVEELPGSDSRPGLRRGNVIWDGFSPGRETLRARVSLDPQALRFVSLPLEVSVRMLSAGRAAEVPVDGPVTVELRIKNITASTQPVFDGVPEPRALSGLLDVLRARLRAGRAPVAGLDGVPERIGARSSGGTDAISVVVPFRVRGTLSFPEGALVDDRGTPVRDLRFDLLIPSVDASDGVVVIRQRGTARALESPAVSMNAVVATPDARALTPARAGTGRTALRVAQRTLWQVLRMAEYEAFLGNPFGGRSRARFIYEPMEVVAAPAPPEDPLEPRPIPIAMAVVALIGLVTGATVVWRRS